ncbi:MAG: extracellular solute-binding protein [Clostridiales bacterium]|nr:extracellular solute-binding protein [Clostridiales bacterium]
MKKILALLLVLALAFGATACAIPAGGDSTTAQDASAQTQEAAAPEATAEPTPMEKAITNVVTNGQNVDIVFWTGTGSSNFPYLEAIVAAFMAKYPNITVDFSNQGPISDLTDKLTQNIVSGSTPQLSNINSGTFPEYVKNDVLVDLSEYVNDPTIGFTSDELADFFANYMAEVKTFGEEGTLYGFPTNKKTTDVLIYNKTYFDAKGWSAPTTWGQVVEYSKAIFEETGKPGFSYDTAYGDAAFKLLSMQYGSPYVTADGTVDIDNLASADALRFYKQNMDAGYFTLPALMPSAGGNYSNNGFVVQECYMYVGAAAGVAYAIPNAEKGQEVFEVGVAPLPQLVTNNPIAFSKGEDYVMFSNSTDEQRVATWLLIKFLSQAENNVEWLINTGNLPISQSMVDNADYQAFLNQTESGTASYYKAQAVKAALQMNDYMRFDVAFDRSGELASEISNMWTSIMVGGADIATTLTATQAMFN